MEGEGGCDYFSGAAAWTSNVTRTVGQQGKGRHSKDSAAQSWSSSDEHRLLRNAAADTVVGAGRRRVRSHPVRR